MIKSSDLSVVVQGKIFTGSRGSTLDVLQSIRKYFPRCELIFSTWNTEQVCSSSASLCDCIIQSDDPGDYTDSKDTPININRQIISSREGIKRATRPFVIKTRSDLIFKSESLLSVLNKEYASRKALTENRRLIAANFSTRSHTRGLKIPYWICDFIYAGRKSALDKMFSVELMKSADFTYYKARTHPRSYADKKHFYRFSPESYLTYSYLEAEKKVPFEHSYDNNAYSLAAYESGLLKNFMILNKWELGVDSLKYHLPFNSHQIMLSSFSFKTLLRKNNNEKVSYVASDFAELSLAIINRVFRRRLR